MIHQCFSYSTFAERFFNKKLPDPHPIVPSVVTKLDPADMGAIHSCNESPWLFNMILEKPSVIEFI
jgi:hypothetical protein